MTNTSPRRLICPVIKTFMEIHEGQEIPAFYGIAYRDYLRKCIICFPIPLNWLVRWERALGFWLRRLFPWQNPSDRTGRYHKASYNKGFNAGIKSSIDYLSATKGFSPKFIESLRK